MSLQFEREAYTERNAVERTIGPLKRYRGVSTRCDGSAVRYEAAMALMDRTSRS